MQSESRFDYDEMLDENGAVRPAYAQFRNWFEQQDPKWLRKQDAAAEGFFRRIGITFNVYGDDDAEERLIPFDMIPRIITAREWRRLTLWLDLNSNELGWIGNDPAEIQAQREGAALWPPIDIDPANPLGLGPSG